MNEEGIRGIRRTPDQLIVASVFVAASTRKPRLPVFLVLPVFLTSEYTSICPQCLLSACSAARVVDHLAHENEKTAGRTQTTGRRGGGRRNAPARAGAFYRPRGNTRNDRLLGQQRR